MSVDIVCASLPKLLIYPTLFRFDTIFKKKKRPRLAFNKVLMKEPALIINF